jgi:hypothetical protein
MHQIALKTIPKVNLTKIHACIIIKSRPEKSHCDLSVRLKAAQPANKGMQVNLFEGDAMCYAFIYYSRAACYHDHSVFYSIL